MDNSPRRLRFGVDGRVLDVDVPGDSIFGGVKDILINREYEIFPAFELTQRRHTVIDAGANIGLYSIIAAIWAEKVIALEPYEPIFKLLSDNVSANGFRNVILKKSALWKNKAVVGFYRRGSTQLGTIRARKNVEPIPVEAISLKELIHENIRDEDPQIDLLKLDIEGSEFEVIESSDEKLLNGIRRVVAEIHVLHGSIPSLTRKLRQCGFSYVLTKRPIQKKQDGTFKLLHDYQIKLLMRTINLVMDLSRFRDDSSLLLFASKDQDDFSPSDIASLGKSVVDASLV